MLSHAKPEHECALCQKKFNLKQSLLCHIQSVHGNNDRPYKCDGCDRAFKRAAHLKRHKVAHIMIRGKLVTCPICRTGFTRKLHLDRHLFVHYRDDALSRNRGDGSSHMHVPTKSSSLEVKCELCKPTRYFANTEDFKCHLAHHYNCGEFCCDICDKRFNTEKVLLQHLKCHINRPEKNFECESCKNRFKSAELLRTHVILSHDGHAACLFKCKLCQSAYSTNRQLIHHVKEAHNNVKELKFPCNFCDDSFSSECLLSDHLATHYKLMYFKCSVCKRQFSWIRLDLSYEGATLW